jgi:putative ABC transport system permease protein
MDSRARFHNWLASIFSDCRFALRQLRKSPGLTATVVLTLALGIGVNTALFSLLNGWLLRPLPVPVPEEITVLASQQKEGSNGNFSYPDFLDFQKQADRFSTLFGYAFGFGGLSADGDAREIVYLCVSGNYFSGLGVKPVVGRFFFPGEGEKAGGELLAVLGYSFWQTKFGGNTNVVGKSVRVNGKEARVIGVAHKDFNGTQFAMDTDAYLPLSAVTLADDSGNFWTDRSARWLTIMGRLKRGSTLQQAQSSLDVIAARLAAQYPQADKDVEVSLVCWFRN